MVNNPLIKTKIIEEKLWRAQYLCKRSNVGIFFFVIVTLSICYTLFVSSETFTTYLQVKTSLVLFNLTNDEKNLSYASSKNRSCPKTGIVTGSTNGRLGNHLWEYASVWLRAKKAGLEPFVTNSTITTLSPLLDNLDIPIVEDIAYCSVGKGIRFENMWIPNNSIVLGVYEESPDLLAENINDINKIFTIKKSYLDKGEEILKASFKWLNSSVGTYVGVHVRRTDYFNHLKILYNYIPTNITTFIKSAMAYYERKYPNPIFIVVSDDPDWCFDAFGSKRNVYVSSKYHESSPELDMAIMASCNHSIIDYGTYGQWGALFAGGETVFYKIDESLSSEKLSKHLKHWHPLKHSDILDSGLI